MSQAEGTACDKARRWGQAWGKEISRLRGVGDQRTRRTIRKVMRAGLYHPHWSCEDFRMFSEQSGVHGKRCDEE